MPGARSVSRKSWSTEVLKGGCGEEGMRRGAIRPRARAIHGALNVGCYITTTFDRGHLDAKVE